MTVSFSSNPAAISLKQLRTVEEQKAQAAAAQPTVDVPQRQPAKKEGFVGKSVNAWVGFLKFKEGVKAYTGGFFRGIKNAVYAGAAIVGIDWFTTSAMKVGATAVKSGKKEAAKAFGHMVATPFAVVGKTISNAAKFIFGGKNVESIFVRPNSQTLKLAFVEAPKRVLNKIYNSKHISPVAKWGLPIIAATTLAYTTIRSVLNYNEAATRLEHRYHTDGFHKA